MTKSYATPEAFRRALEDRLRAVATTRAVQIDGLRMKVAIERLLARLFADPSAPWRLKGGYAMELRYRPRARTTRDVDLSVPPLQHMSSSDRADEVLDALQIAVERDLEDFFEFRIERPRRMLARATLGGATYSVTALLAGRTFAIFHIDVGFGDAVSGDAERLVGDTLLDFAGVPAATALAISKEQQFAEKIHAYTYPWADRVNTRTKDLVDMLMLIERGAIDANLVAAAIRATFRMRDTHPIPDELAPSPSEWREDYEQLAADVGLAEASLGAAHETLSEFWASVAGRIHGAM